MKQSREAVAAAEQNARVAEADKQKQIEAQDDIPEWPEFLRQHPDNVRLAWLWICGRLVCFSSDCAPRMRLQS